MSYLKVLNITLAFALAMNLAPVELKNMSTNEIITVDHIPGLKPVHDLILPDLIPEDENTLEYIFEQCTECGVLIEEQNTRDAISLAMGLNPDEWNYRCVGSEVCAYPKRSFILIKSIDFQIFVASDAKLNRTEYTFFGAHLMPEKPYHMPGEIDFARFMEQHARFNPMPGSYTVCIKGRSRYTEQAFAEDMLRKCASAFNLRCFQWDPAVANPNLDLANDLILKVVRPCLMAQIDGDHVPQQSVKIVRAETILGTLPEDSPMRNLIGTIWYTAYNRDNRNLAIAVDESHPIASLIEERQCFDKWMSHEDLNQLLQEYSNAVMNKIEQMLNGDEALCNLKVATCNPMFSFVSLGSLYSLFRNNRMFREDMPGFYVHEG